VTALELLDRALPASAHETPRQSLRKLLLPLFRRVAESSHAGRAESVRPLADRTSGGVRKQQRIQTP